MFIIVEQKAPNGLANVFQLREQVLVGHLFAAVEIDVFDAGVLVGLALLDAFVDHATSLRSFDENFHANSDLWSVRSLQQLCLLANAPEDAPHPLSGDRVVDLTDKRLNPTARFDRSRPGRVLQQTDRQGSSCCCRRWLRRAKPPPRCHLSRANPGLLSAQSNG